MRVSIIPQDNRIIVDGKTVDLDDNDIRWTFDDEHIHAIQWKDSMGEIEYEDEIGKDPLPNKIFGQDQFDTIVKPYITFFEGFLTLSEKRSLQNSILENEKVANESNELLLSKLQEEENLLIIDELQKQNKEVREKHENLSVELDKIVEEKILSERELKINHEKELLEKEAEIQGEKIKKIDDYFKNKASELANYIETLLTDFEKEKQEFYNERNQFADYINNFKNSIDAEVEEIQKDVVANENRRLMEMSLFEKRAEQTQAEIMMMKENAEMEKLNYDLALEDLENERLRVQNERRADIENIKLREKELELEKEELLLDISLRKEISLADKINKDEEDALSDWESEESNKIENEYVRKQIEKFDDFITERQETYQDIENRIKLNELNDNSSNEITDISSILDEIDPQDFYNTLTDEDREDQSFPIQKATAWFNKLKEVMEKNES